MVSIRSCKAQNSVLNLKLVNPFLKCLNSKHLIEAGKERLNFQVGIKARIIAHHGIKLFNYESLLLHCVKMPSPLFVVLSIFKAQSRGEVPCMFPSVPH